MADKKQKQSITQELRALDEQALTTKLAELKKELVEQHRAHAAQELPGSHLIGKTRKQIAIINTLLAEAKRKAPQKEEK
jgi:ribosomal protein L29